MIEHFRLIVLAVSLARIDGHTQHLWPQRMRRTS